MTCWIVWLGARVVPHYPDWSCAPVSDIALNIRPTPCLLVTATARRSRVAGWQIEACGRRLALTYGRLRSTTFRRSRRAPRDHRVGVEGELAVGRAGCHYCRDGAVKRGSVAPAHAVAGQSVARVV